jgi:hypothetical protein
MIGVYQVLEKSTLFVVSMIIRYYKYNQPKMVDHYV